MFRLFVLQLMFPDPRFEHTTPKSCILFGLNVGTVSLRPMRVKLRKYFQKTQRFGARFSVFEENFVIKLIKNIAGRLPENSRNRFVDRQSKKKTVKKTGQKNSSFH